jgi:transposase-like protein
MPWKETTNMSQRKEFIAQAKVEGVNFSALCRLFGISRKTGYKWLKWGRKGKGPGDRRQIPKERVQATNNKKHEIKNHEKRSVVYNVYI